MKKIPVDNEVLQDIINLSVGLFYPLDGFMDSKDYKSVLDNYRLSNGEVFTIPITFDIENFINVDEIIIEHDGRIVAKIEVEDVYEIKLEDVFKIYKTLDTNHPGVKKELQRGRYKVGGKVKILDSSILSNALTPKKTKELFKKHKTVAGFQTRNIPHRAHEYLHRLALEFCDALFINPLVGWRKKGDFTEDAILIGYKALIDNYYNGLNVYFETLKMPMRYAGPREAIFHAIIRRNLGCTHFIIGRDHAGVGNYYGKYEAHNLAKELQKDLDIELLLFKEPFYCKKCEQIVSENCCAHLDKKVSISGTEIRRMLKNKQIPPKEFLRKEVAESLLKLEKIFV